MLHGTLHNAPAKDEDKLSLRLQTRSLLALSLSTTHFKPTHGCSDGCNYICYLHDMGTECVWNPVQSDTRSDVYALLCIILH